MATNLKVKIIEKSNIFTLENAINSFLTGLGNKQINDVQLQGDPMHQGDKIYVGTIFYDSVMAGPGQASVKLFEQDLPAKLQNDINNFIASGTGPTLIRSSEIILKNGNISYIGIVGYNVGSSGGGPPDDDAFVIGPGSNSAQLNGSGSLSNGDKSVAEGLNTTANGVGSHSEGEGTLANADGSHAEGQGTQAQGIGSHSEGQATEAGEQGSHAEGQSSVAAGIASHAEGQGTTANGEASHTEGQGTTANGVAAHAEGGGARADGDGSHAEGQGTEAAGQASHSEGLETTANGVASHAEGEGAIADGDESHAEGQNTNSIGQGSHSEGVGTASAGIAAHSEGQETEATSDNSHAGGYQTFLDRMSEFGRADGFFGLPGDSQYTDTIFKIITDNANPTALRASDNSVFAIKENSLLSFKIQLSGVCITPGGSTFIGEGLTAHIEGGVKNISGVCSFTGGLPSINIYADTNPQNDGWSVDLVIAGGNLLAVAVVGAADTTIYWNAKISVVEILYIPS